MRCRISRNCPRNMSCPTVGDNPQRYMQFWIIRYQYQCWVRAGFVTTDHRRDFSETKAPFGLSDFFEHARLVARCDTPLTWLLTVTCGETKLL